MCKYVCIASTCTLSLSPSDLGNVDSYMTTCILNSILIDLKTYNWITVFKNRGLANVVFLLVLLIKFIWLIKEKKKSRKLSFIYVLAVFWLVPFYLWVECHNIAIVSCPINKYLLFSERQKMGVLSLVKVHNKEDILEFMWILVHCH